jgi:hypothetical protein
MKTRDGRFVVSTFLAAAALVAVCASATAKDRKHLTRSLYIPVRFQTCEHLSKATLYIGDQAVAQLPSERVFLFTYYPDLKRVEPAVTELRIEGMRDDDTPFIGRMAVDPTAIFTADERIDLDFEAAKKQLTYRIDSHYEPVTVVIRCSASCNLRDRPVMQVSQTAPREEVAVEP